MRHDARHFLCAKGLHSRKNPRNGERQYFVKLESALIAMEEYKDQEIKEVNHTPIKTRLQWEESGKDLREFLNVGDRIDEDLWNYLGEVVSPEFIAWGIVQCGEPVYHRQDTSFHETAVHFGSKYFYLGVLPSFHGRS